MSKRRIKNKHTCVTGSHAHEKKRTEGLTVTFPHTLCDAHTVPEVTGVRTQGQAGALVRSEDMRQ